MPQILLTSLAVMLRILSNPLANVFQKQLTAKGIAPLRVNVTSYLMLSLGCLLPAMNIAWSRLPAAFWIYSFCGGLLGAVGNGFLIKALQQGDLSVLGPVNAYKSVVGLLFGMLLLGEFPNLWGLLGIVLIIWGSYFVLDTTQERFSPALLRRKEIQYRIWAMLLTAVEAVFVKKVILASSTTIAFISWCWFGALFSFLLLKVSKVPGGGVATSAASHIRRYIFLVVCIGTMQYTTNYVFEHMDVGYALSLFQLSTVVSVFLGYRFFKEQDIRKKLLGTLIMLAGSVLIILVRD